MKPSVLKAYLALLLFDFYLSGRGFTTLYDRVRKYPVAVRSEQLTAQEVCDVVDLASIWYWKEVLCLQRSAATTCLLRKYGIAAKLVIGAQQMPFKAHAWVEVAGRVVNDKPYTPEMFAVVDRC